MSRQRSQAQRDRAAQGRLRAAGQAAGSLRGAEYRWRKFKGSQLGLSAGQAVGKPHKGELAATELRAAGRLAPVVPFRRPRATRHTDLGAMGDIYRSNSRRYIKEVLRQAKRGGKRVSVTIHAKDDERYRTRKIDGRDSLAMDHMRRTIALANGRKGIIPTANRPGEVTLTQTPQLFITDNADAFSGPGRGIDPGELDDYLDAYVDIDDAWADFWDEFDS